MPLRPSHTLSPKFIKIFLDGSHIILQNVLVQLLHKLTKVQHDVVYCPCFFPPEIL